MKAISESNHMCQLSQKGVLGHSFFDISTLHSLFYNSNSVFSRWTVAILTLQSLAVTRME